LRHPQFTSILTCRHPYRHGRHRRGKEQGGTHRQEDQGREERRRQRPDRVGCRQVRE